MLEVGDSFTLRNENGIHLHVIVAERSPGNHDSVMLVYTSTAERYRDDTTVLKVGDHPYITKECFIRYRNLLIRSRQEVEPCIVEHFGKVSDDLLNQIQSGILKSEFVSKRDKSSFSQWNMDRLMRNPDF